MCWDRSGVRIGGVPEAGFSDDQTKLNWHIGQVRSSKLDSFKKGKSLLSENSLSFWPYLAQVLLKFCLETEKQASVPYLSTEQVAPRLTSGYSAQCSLWFHTYGSGWEPPTPSSTSKRNGSSINSINCWYCWYPVSTVDTVDTEVIRSFHPLSILKGLHVTNLTIDGSTLLNLLRALFRSKQTTCSWVRTCGSGVNFMSNK